MERRDADRARPGNGRGPRPGAERARPGAGPEVAPRSGAARREEIDEVVASAARARYRAEGIAPVATVADVAAVLDPGERIFATHSPAVVRRRTSPEATTELPALAGDLHLTGSRLVLMGPVPFQADLEEIEEAVLAGDRLLLVMRRGVGLEIDVDRPGLLRVQIAAARAVGRGPAHLDGAPRARQVSR